MTTLAIPQIGAPDRSVSASLSIGAALTVVIGVVGLGCDRFASAMGWTFPSFGYLATTVIWKLATLGLLGGAVLVLDGGRLNPVNLGLRRPEGWSPAETKARNRPAILGLLVTILLAGPFSLLGSSLGSASSYGGRLHVGAWLLACELILVYPLTVLAEELVFRGWLQPKLGRWAPVMSGLFWAAQHLQQWRTIPSLIPLGIGLGIIRWWSGTIRITGTLHYLSDSTFFVLNYA